MNSEEPRVGYFYLVVFGIILFVVGYCLVKYLQTGHVF